ncbi:hypothetical protein SXCC_00350 [Gluconacetobacter sp. SXCC-1]|nr:hypothetical protein SXCC_00350 [Gluconacetobacter sp. SXCC-1]
MSSSWGAIGVCAFKDLNYIHLIERWKKDVKVMYLYACV